MHLSPADTEKLMLAVAGMVARDRLERGVRLNYPEAVALLTNWVIERARDGVGVPELMSAGRRVLTVDQVMPGVAEMIDDVQVEATFPDGRKLVTLHHPIDIGDGGDERAPDPHTDTVRHGPGAVRTLPGTVELNTGRDTISLVILNTGDRPVQIGSHIHLPDTNPALEFDRDAAAGFRLDIPSGTSRRFEPGVSARVDAVRLAGRGVVPGIQLGNQPGKAG